MTAERMIKITLVGSFIGCTERQRGTLRGLGLTRRGRCVVRLSTSPILGMISKVSHLVKVED
ncbi:MAG: 50S ribosomal protein L30 [Candidatus Binatia bacterium]